MVEQGEDDPKPEPELDPLTAVRQRIANRLRKPISIIPPPPEGSTVEEGDALFNWKKRIAGGAVTLDQIHIGLIAVVEYSEAAIESGIKMAADVRLVKNTLEAREEQLAVLATRIETAAQLAKKVEEEIAKTNKSLDASEAAMLHVRRDVQYLKDEMVEVKDHVKQIPALKELLGEILERLPEPSVKR